MLLTPPGPSLADRIARLEERLNAMETSTGTAKTGTDCSMQGSHDRLDTLLGAGCPSANFEVAHPASPSAYDDEFDDGVLAAKWSVGSSGVSFDETSWPGWFSARFTGASQYIWISQNVSLPASTSLRLMARVSYQMNNIGQIALMQALDAVPSSNGMVVSVGRDAGGVYIEFKRQTAGSWYQIEKFYLVNWGATFTFGICRSTANQWLGFFSQEGLSYVVTGLYQQAQTVGKIYLNFDMGTTFTRTTRVGVDWFRSYLTFPWP